MKELVGNREDDHFQARVFPGVSQFIPNGSSCIPKALYSKKVDVLKKIMDHLCIFKDRVDSEIGMV